MASRWTDSGINWANLNLHENRTSWIIDELYRAFKERESMLNYYTDQESSVLSWDVLNSTRDMNKLDEIMLGLQTWLNSSASNFSRFFDTTSNPDGQALTGGLLFGLPYFDSTALGSLETLVGVSLDKIRNWNTVGFRIDTDLLQMIYDVLVELTDIIAIRNVAFQGVFPSNNLFDFESTQWQGADIDYSSAITDYTNDTPSTGVSGTGSLGNRFATPTSYSVVQVNTKLVNDDFKDSSNVSILLSDLTVFGYKFNDTRSGTDPIAGFIYDEFELINASAGELHVFNETHPFSFTEITVTGDEETLLVRAYPIVDINNMSAIQYYT